MYLCEETGEKRIHPFSPDLHFPLTVRLHHLPLCSMHNDVNKRLGKPMFDCSQADARWRDVCECISVSG